MSVKKMTRPEAQEEARRRWSDEDAAIEHVYPGTPYEQFRVGRFNPESWQPNWLGIGTSWEDAFADADRSSQF